MISIAIANQKGGVGKTTIAFNLAWTLSQKKGVKVLCIDNDPQGNLTSSFLESPESLKSNIIRAYEGLELIPQAISKGLDFIGADIRLSSIAERGFQMTFRLKEYLENLSPESYDYAVIDSLPSFGNLHLAALTAAQYVLVPVRPSPYALYGMKDLFDTIDRAGKYMNPGLKVLGIVINKVDGRRLVMEREMEEIIRETYGGLVFKNTISRRVRYEESPVFQKSVIAYETKGVAAKEFRALSTEIVARIKKMEG